MKLKICSECKKECYLFKSRPALCSSCARKYQKPINKVSDTHKETLKQYKPIREEYLKEHPNCQLKLEGCLGIASEIEHRSGKATKELYLDSSKYFAVCRVCHIQVEVLGTEAYEKGFKIKHNQIKQ